MKLALLGAGGKMGVRLARNLKGSRFHVAPVEVSPAGQERLKQETGFDCVDLDAALAGAEAVILAVPDTAIKAVSHQIVDKLASGTLVIALDAAAPFAGHLPARDDLTYFVTHPCHPPIFNDESDPAARRDFFGGVAAAQSVVSALMQGPEEHFALEARLEARNLRYVTFDGSEVLRAIAYVIRDENWGTYAPELENLAVEEGEARFRVTYDGTCRSPSAALRFRAEIEGAAEGLLSFLVIAEADGAFLTNRCGFTVLHPIEGVAGEAVTVEHSDGTCEKSRFPALIEPWQPFKEIRALTHSAGGLYRATCRLEGEVFEMEDHRNWSDASFKTYVRPLAWPWPYVLETGKVGCQAVTLKIEDDAAACQAADARRRHSAGEAVNIAVERPQEPAQRHPDIGLVVAPEEIEATIANLDVVTAAGAQVILCHYDPTAGHGAEAFKGFARLQRALPGRYLLECVVAGEGDLEAELAGVAQAIAEAGLQVSAVAVCPSVDRQSTPPGSAWPACPPLEEIYAAARMAFPGLPLGGGMFTYFTELNRKRPPVDLLDFVTHSTCPIVHAADDESVMETLEALPHITASARAIIGAEKRYHIGPSTIAMRQNPYGARTMANPEGDRICMAEVDPRHFGLFSAAWTTGYAAGIAQGAPALHVPAATVGPRGLVWPSSGGRHHETERQLRHSPVAHAIGLLAQMAGGKVLPCRSSDHQRALALAARTGTGRMVVVANITATPIEIRLSGLAGPGTWTLEVLDTDSWDPSESPSSAAQKVPWNDNALTLDSFALGVFREFGATH